VVNTSLQIGVQYSDKNLVSQHNWRHKGLAWASRRLVTANVDPSPKILVTLMMEALRTAETSGLTRATRRIIPEDAIRYSNRRENLKSYICNYNFQEVRNALESLSEVNTANINIPRLTDVTTVTSEGHMTLSWNNIIDLRFRVLLLQRFLRSILIACSYCDRLMTIHSKYQNGKQTAKKPK
jgi:hypothetical protein